MKSKLAPSRTVLRQTGATVLILGSVMMGCGYLDRRLEARRRFEAYAKPEVYTEIAEWFTSRRNEGTLPGFERGERGTIHLVETNLATEVAYPYEVKCVVEKQDDTRFIYEYELIKDRTNALWRLKGAAKVGKVTGDRTDLLPHSSGQ